MTLTAFIAIALGATSTSEFQSTLDDYRREQQVPGVSAVVTQKGEVVFAGGSGVSDLESERAMSPDTVVYAGSLSKILTAVLVLNLVETGELRFEDVAPGKSITVRHLLTHSSGLDREGDFGYWFSANFPDEGALRQYLQRTELRATPGTSFHYSNIGFATLGLIIEQASDQSFGNALIDRVINPLLMNSSGTQSPAPDVAAGYSPEDRVIPNAARPFAGLGRRVGNRHLREYHGANAMTPAFGVHTTALDLSRLSRFLLGYGGDDVLSDNMRSQMLSEQAPGWGLGIRVGQYKGHPIARHSGWFAAHQSHLLLERRSDISVVVMTNSDSASPGKIAEALLDIALRTDAR